MSHKQRLVIAFIVVILSLILGLYSKVMIVLSIGDTFNFWLNVILYAFSWVLLFFAIFFIGKEVVAIADEYVKRKIKEGTKHGGRQVVKHSKKIHGHVKKHGKKIGGHVVKHGKNIKRVIKSIK